MLCYRRITRKGLARGMQKESSLTPPHPCLQAIRSQQEKSNSDEKWHSLYTFAKLFVCPERDLPSSWDESTSEQERRPRWNSRRWVGSVWIASFLTDCFTRLYYAFNLPSRSPLASEGLRIQVSWHEHWIALFYVQYNARCSLWRWGRLPQEDPV